MRKLLFVLASIVLLFACTPEETKDSGTDDPINGGDTTVEQKEDIPVTVGAEHISAISVELKGRANVKNNGTSVMLGFQYYKVTGSESPSITTLLSTNADETKNFSVVIAELEPSTTYSYRSFVRQNGQDTYGETKEFTTKDIESLLETKDASSIEATSALLNAKLDLTEVQYKTMNYGFLWGTSESALNTDYKCTEISDNAISAALTNLSHKTQYWYKAYVKLDSQTFYGEVKTFTTDVVPVESVSLDKTEYTFNTIGNSLTLKATVLPADATEKSIEWSSDNTSVVTVDSDGRVTAVGNGNATVTVTTKDQGKTATCVITVAQWVTGISLDQASITLSEGEKQALVAAISPENAADKTLKWTSSDEAVATVDNNGTVTAVSKGMAFIMATANDGSGKCAWCSVIVKRIVSSIQLNKTSQVLYRGASNVWVQLTATVIPSDASNTAVTWTSSNTSVATVSSYGFVTGVSKGTATITVTANDGYGAQATCEVEVKQYVTSITLDKTSLSLVIGDEVTLSVTSILPDNANDKTYTWSSSDSAIASVDNSGKVTANAKGNATIMATANDESGVFASCSVDVITVPQAVDMGTVVNGKNVKWASFNIGASSPKEYGYYYAWGETEPKEVYSWSTYKFGTSSSGPFSKYGSVDHKTVLEAVDDVASVRLGGKWRMPTDAEWTELRNNCSWTWTSQNGVNGYKVTATNGNSIFLPAAGYWGGTRLDDAGSWGHYWSSSLSTEPDHARTVFFYSYNVIRNDNYRFRGLSVRPVTE